MPWNNAYTPITGPVVNPYPYMTQPTTTMPMNVPPHYDIVKVSGRQGVDAFQMGPNSSVLLLDETAPIVWLVQTDGAGFKTPTPFSITPYEQPAPINVNDLEERIKKLEGLVNEQLQSNFNSGKQSKRQRNNQSDATNTAGQGNT